MLGTRLGLGGPLQRRGCGICRKMRAIYTRKDPPPECSRSPGGPLISPCRSPAHGFRTRPGSRGRWDPWRSPTRRSLDAGGPLHRPGQSKKSPLRQASGSVISCRALQAASWSSGSIRYDQCSSSSHSTDPSPGVASARRAVALHACVPLSPERHRRGLGLRRVQRSRHLELA